ncbi:MAG: hypothetical protein J3K34DRAFT_437671 [Monoraphidium minutum]|nr:MAG: hypothetical protein J3K34DRAFT_437671 [Monoraphidium minutum]
MRSFTAWHWPVPVRSCSVAVSPAGVPAPWPPPLVARPLRRHSCAGIQTVSKLAWRQVRGPCSQSMHAEPAGTALLQLRSACTLMRGGSAGGASPPPSPPFAQEGERGRGWCPPPAQARPARVQRPAWPMFCMWGGVRLRGLGGLKSPHSPVCGAHTVLTHI